ncbi:hypothetical protein, partial [Mycoplasma zalophi]|uniref:hypothetical protein n=1 Tax=Mycoplasma zalophi TaxID=191287 RepID=UPI00248AD372
MENVIIPRSTHKFKALNITGYLYPVIQQGDNPILGYSNESNIIINYKKFILFGDHTFSLYKPNSPFLIATDGIKLIETLKVDRDFLYHSLTKIDVGLLGYKRHFSQLKETIIYLTNNEKEQIKIATVLNVINENVSLLKRLWFWQKNQLFYVEKTAFLLKNTFVWFQDKVKNLFKITRGQVLNTNKLKEFPSEKYKYPVFSSKTIN